MPHRESTLARSCIDQIPLLSMYHPSDRGCEIYFYIKSRKPIALNHLIDYISSRGFSTCGRGTERVYICVSPAHWREGGPHIIPLMGYNWKAIHWGDFSPIWNMSIFNSLFFLLTVLPCNPVPKVWPSTLFPCKPPSPRPLCPSRRTMSSSGKQSPASAWGFDFSGLFYTS